MSVRAHSKDRSEDVVVPDVQEPLYEEDYPDVPYWHDKDWITHTERQKDRGNVVTRLGFLTDRDGKVVSESQIKAFTSVAKQAWNKLYRHRLDPSSWTKKTSKVASFLANTLKAKFVKFCYCNGDWKVGRFAIIKYPDWCRDGRDSGRLTRTPILSLVACFFLFQVCSLFPSFSVVLGARPSKRRIGDSDNTNDNRRRKKVKAEPMVPSGTQVIDLVDDVPTGSGLPSFQTDPSTSTTLQPQPPRLAQQVPLTPAIVSVATANISSPPPNPTTLPSPPAPSDSTGDAPPRLARQLLTSENTASSVILSPPTMDAALGQQVERRQINPL